MCRNCRTRGADIAANIRLIIATLLRNPSTKLVECEGTILANIHLMVTSSSCQEITRDTENIVMKIISLVIRLEHNLIAINAENMIVCEAIHRTEIA